jgi:hypothetical protein
MNAISSETASHILGYLLIFISLCLLQLFTSLTEGVNR